jgi:hypothetical protein
MFFSDFILGEKKQDENSPFFSIGGGKGGS